MQVRREQERLVTVAWKAAMPHRCDGPISGAPICFPE